MDEASTVFTNVGVFSVVPDSEGEDAFENWKETFSLFVVEVSIPIAST